MKHTFVLAGLRPALFIGVISLALLGYGGCRGGQEEAAEKSHGSGHAHDEHGHGEQEQEGHGHEGCSHEKEAHKEEAHEKEGVEEHAEEGCGCAENEEEEHGHGHAGPGLSLDELHEKRCEHEVAALECDECRYELGVVKVPEKVACKLLDTVIVGPPDDAKKGLSLRCELGIDELHSTQVVALRAGRVKQIMKTLGQKVEPGDVLAVLYSDSYSEARREHSEAHQRLKVEDARLKRLQQVQGNLQTLLDKLKEADGSPLEEEVLAGLIIGEEKGRLLAAANAFRSATVEWGREMMRVKDTRMLLAYLAGENSKVDVDSLVGGEWKERLLTARAELRLARKTYKRAKELASKGISARKELDVATRDLSVAGDRFDAAMEAVRLDMDRTETEMSLRVQTARAAFLSALEGVSLRIDIERLEAEQELEHAKLKTAVSHRQLEMFGLKAEELESLPDSDSAAFGLLEVRAPAAGVIIGQQAALGQSVPEGEGLFSVADMSTVWAWCDVYNRDFPAMLTAKPPFEAVVEVDAFAHRRFPGTVDYVGHTLDVHTRTVKVRVVLPNPDGLLRPGMFVRAAVELPKPGKSIRVPASAVVFDEDYAFVFKHWKEGYWVRRNITVGEKLGDSFEVLTGVAPGDELAVRGAFFLKSDVLREKMGAGCAD